MNEAKKYQILDLIEKIERVDRMIKNHSSNPSKFMTEQYEAKKVKLLGYLIDELINSKVRSPFSFKLIILALRKFYPELIKKENKRELTKNRNYKEFKELEAILV